MNNQIFKFTLLFFFSTLHVILFSQVNNSTDIETDTTSIKQKNDNLETKINSLQESMEKLIKIIADDKDNSINIGTFKLFKSDAIDVYYYEGKKTKYKDKKKANYKITIKKVIVDISNGYIADIQIETKENKTFTNGRSPIEINKFHRCDLLSFRQGADYYYIQTCDFMNFIRNGNYIADDDRFELTKKDNTKTLTKDVGINSVINIKLYTDLLGTFGGEENGLIQTEANFKTPILTTNIKNLPVFGLHYFTANLRLSKFDDKFKYTSAKYSKNDTIINGTDTTYIKADTTFSRQTINQRNWFNFDIGFNILSGHFSNKSKSTWSLDFISGFSLSNFKNNSDTIILALPYVGFNPSIKIVPAPNFGISLSAQFFWQFCPQLEMKNEKAKFVFSPEFELFWNPLKSPGSRVFTRIKYVVMHGEGNPFFLWQLGYNFSLSELINKKLENK